MHNTWFYFRFFLGQVLETKMLRRLQSKSKIIRLSPYDVCDIIGKKFRGGFKEPYSSDVRNHIHVDYKYIKVISGVSNTCELNTADNIHLLHDILSYYTTYALIARLKCACSTTYILTARHVSGRPALSFSAGSTMPSFTAKSRLLSEMMGYGSLSDEHLT